MIVPGCASCVSPLEQGIRKKIEYMFNICMILNRPVLYRIIFNYKSGRISVPQSKQIQEE